MFEHSFYVGTFGAYDHAAIRRRLVAGQRAPRGKPRGRETRTTPLACSRPVSAARGQAPWSQQNRFDNRPGYPPGAHRWQVKIGAWPSRFLMAPAAFKRQSAALRAAAYRKNFNCGGRCAIIYSAPAVSFSSSLAFSS